MSDFQTAADLVIKQEGENSYDSGGGLTKYGIAQRWHPSIDVTKLDIAGACSIYKSEYWFFDGVKDQKLANLLLSLAVNMGPATAISILQKALGILVDGKWGHLTESTANNYPDAAIDMATQAIIYYTSLCKPLDEKGWYRRVSMCLVS